MDDAALVQLPQRVQKLCHDGLHHDGCAHHRLVHLHDFVERETVDLLRDEDALRAVLLVVPHFEGVVVIDLQQYFFLVADVLLS